MPIYEYQCQECQHIFEELVYREDEIVRCPECGSDDTSKLMSCCRFKTGHRHYVDHASEAPSMPATSTVKGGCAGCSGGNCSSCG